MNQTDSSASEPKDSLPETTLDDLPTPVRAAAHRAGWSALMAVQAKAIPYLMAGRNMMIQARTGSGKTGAFILPMLQKLNASLPHCQALVLVPTRELARQVWEATTTLCGDSGFRAAAVYGGVGYSGQMEALRQGAHIVVGTPGRVLDHLIRRTLVLDHLAMLIYDEADRMLSMGFYPDMRRIQRFLPARPPQGCMFSATFPAQVLRTAREFIRNPEFLSLSRDHVHVTDTEHVFYVVPGMDKDRALIRIIEIENPPSAIIFCNTKSEVHYVSVVLQRFGYDADELSADLSQTDRERVLGRVRQGTLRFLVATDVAARGLDIPELSHVVLYQVPEDIEGYIHRAGRTGRAGAPGTAMTLVSGPEEEHALRAIARHYGIDMQRRPLPSDEDVQAVVAERATALLEARLRERDKLKTERSRRFVPLARDLAENEDEAAIIAMLVDDFYQQALHAPAIPPEPPPPRERPVVHPPSSRRRAPRRRR